jgi:hypothetical protein
MLTDLRKYENLGSSALFYKMLTRMNNSIHKEWKLYELRELLYLSITADRNIYDGCLPLAIDIGVLHINNNTVIIDSKIKESLEDKSTFSQKFLEYVFTKYINDKEFVEIFSPQNMSFDIENNIYQVCNSAFGFKYSSLKKLFVDFNLLLIHPKPQVKKFIGLPSVS